ncbi:MULTISPECIES: hypothetical protein [unclassified Rathayibacter]|nr:MULTISPECIES: hypothetical protein [unclassified Rathayibacter]
MNAPHPYSRRSRSARRAPAPLPIAQHPQSIRFLPIAQRPQGAALLLIE